MVSVSAWRSATFLALALMVIAACSNRRGRLVDPMDSGLDDGESQVSWCDVAAVLRDKCQRCHRNPPENGAPFPLLTYADTQRTTGTKMLLIQTRMNQLVSIGRMPATYLTLDPPVEPLTAAEMDTILKWSAQPVGDPEPIACDRL